MLRPVRRRLMLVGSLLPLLLLLSLTARSKQEKPCGALSWSGGCTSLPLGLEDEPYANALAMYRAYQCRLEPVPGLSASAMALRTEAAKELLPRLMAEAGLPLALLENPLFLSDARRMAIELPCKDLELE